MPASTCCCTRPSAERGERAGRRLLRHALRRGPPGRYARPDDRQPTDSGWRTTCGPSHLILRLFLTVAEVGRR